MTCDKRRRLQVRSKTFNWRKYVRRDIIEEQGMPLLSFSFFEEMREGMNEKEDEQ